MKRTMWLLLSWILCLWIGSTLPVWAESSQAEWLQRLESLSRLPLPLVFVLLVFMTFISEDLTCAIAGLLVAQGQFELIPAIAACLIGIFVGDILLVLLGRLINEQTIDRFPFRFLIRRRKLEEAEEWFIRRGPAVVFFSRFVPGSRFPTYLAAGFLRMPLWRFSAYFLVAALLWTPVLVILAWKLGRRILPIIDEYHHWAPLLLVLLIVGLLALFKLILPALSHEGRRRLKGRWNRIRHWEFWPPLVFYTPLTAYVIWLGIRHKSLTLFTAANPFLEDGGFVGESKHRIFDHIPEDLPERVPYQLLPHDLALEEQMNRIETFMQNEQTDFPIVLKPDQGQRGAGVCILYSREECERYLTQSHRDVIVQPRVEGPEFGIFYARHPEEDHGRIISLTRKRLLFLTGNGVHTLKRLILDHPRAVSMAPIHFERWSKHLYDIPADGEIIRLTDLGTHCRGAVFEDGTEYITTELTHRIDELSKQIEGFYFGRFDVRAPDEADLKAGRNLRLLELNGVSSEATHIYDRDATLQDAYQVLARQWRLAFEIGAANHKNGTPVLGVRNLWRRIRHMPIHDIHVAPTPGSP